MVSIPSIRTERAALRVFGVPELARLIFINGRKSDHVNLMRACRRIFYDTLPSVWEEVDDIVPLVSMIPGGGVTSYELDPFPPLMVMRCPNSLSLSRLNIYAPYVKRLVIPSNLPVDEHENMDEFIACSRSANEGLGLLPNLTSIHLSFRHRHYTWGSVQKIGAETINWMIAFLSPSVRTIVATPQVLSSRFGDSAWTDSTLYHKLLMCVSQTCPNLGSLDILPGYVSQSSFKDFTLVRRFSFAYRTPEYQPLLDLKNLVSLLVSPLFLSPELLHTIAGLPALESICIRGLVVDREEYCEDLELPLESFPMLRRVELNGLTWGTMINICGLKPLVAGLQTLCISYPREPSSNSEQDIDDEGLLSHIVSALVAQGSRLAVLDMRLFDPPPRISMAVGPWERLPLFKLRLGWNRWYFDSFEVLYRLLSSLPLLEELIFDDTSDAFCLEDFRKIVQILPNLSYIRIPIAYRSLLTLTDEDFRPFSYSKQALCIESRFAVPKPEEECAMLYALFLSALRPGSQITCKYAQWWFLDRVSNEPVNDRHMNMVLRALDKLRSK